MHAQTPSDASSHAATEALVRLGRGDSRAVDDLMPLVYGQLRALARSFLRFERPGHTLQGTAIVHEAYLRLVDQNRRTYENRAHFFAVAAAEIRRLLVDHARRAKRPKHGGDVERVAIDDVTVQGEESAEELVVLDELLVQLAALDAQKTRVVELRFFTGLSVDEVAAVLGCSASTVARDWRFARAWLRARLADGAAS